MHQRELVSDTVKYVRGYFIPVKERKQNTCKRHNITDRQYKELVVRYYTLHMYDLYSFEEYFHAVVKRKV